MRRRVKAIANAVLDILVERGGKSAAKFDLTQKYVGSINAASITEDMADIFCVRREGGG